MNIKTNNKKLLLTGLTTVSTTFICLAVISTAITAAITVSTAVFAATSTYSLCLLVQWVRAKNSATKINTDPLRNKKNSSKCTKDHSPKGDKKAIDDTIQPQTKVDSTDVDNTFDKLLRQGVLKGDITDDQRKKMLEEYREWGNGITPSSRSC